MRPLSSLLVTSPSKGHGLERDHDMVKASIIIHDDNILLRKYLRMRIEADPSLSFIQESNNVLEYLDQLKDAIPDVIVMDVSLPELSGLDAAEIFKKLYPQIKIVVLAMYSDQYYVHRANEIGVDGYVSINEIMNINNVIKAVTQGKNYISPCFKKKLFMNAMASTIMPFH